MTRGSFAAACALAVAVAFGTASGAAAQGSGAQGPMMPDPKQMSGIPLPVGDLAPGTVTVRVVRGTMTNVIPNQPVELSGGPSPLTANTNDAGRAEFSGLRPGTRLKAATVVNGARIESQEFAVPPTGGIRLALVAPDPDAAKRTDPAAQPQAQGAAEPGSVVFGERTRFVFEMGDEAINVFAILEVLNSKNVPVRPAAPLVIDLPAEALGPGILEGSSPLGTLEGKSIVLSGPFPPGATLVQFGYALAIDGATLTIRQKLPAALAQLSVMAQKVGNMELQSPQIAEHRDMPIQNMTFIVAKGRGLAAGDTLSLTFTGLPHHAVWPRNVALALALAIVGAGAWGTMRSPQESAADKSRRTRLEAKRDRLFAELTVIEEHHRAQTIDPERYATRRRELVSSLERVYAELDEEAAA